MVKPLFMQADTVGALGYTATAEWSQPNALKDHCIKTMGVAKSWHIRRVVHCQQRALS